MSNTPTPAPTFGPHTPREPYLGTQWVNARPAGNDALKYKSLRSADTILAGAK